MSRNQFATEKVIGVLREADVALAQVRMIAKTRTKYKCFFGIVRIHFLPRFTSR
jgi:hypothetical protein